MRSPVIYLSIDDIEILYEGITGIEFRAGVKNRSLLESALAQPEGGFGETEFYPMLFAKAAVLARSLVKNHPFHDGNKRTALMAMISFLYINGYRLKATQRERVEMILLLATSASSETDAALDNVVHWLETHSDLLA